MVQEASGWLQEMLRVISRNRDAGLCRDALHRWRFAAREARLDAEQAAYMEMLRAQMNEMLRRI